MKELATYLEDKQPPVFLSFFGTGDPAYYGIKATMLPCFLDIPAAESTAPKLMGETYCISASMLQPGYLSFAMFLQPWGKAAGKWCIG